ncbi:LLM class flavin-dependent oxidoreductase [Herbiconiux sp. CPCC 203407]|uniref:LLM class flavin-dependent oxidoreductase n=1 Tax=Herbiconiux oxytropis TaxID=2970915 RepID=A0AA41XID4_9MICO|nr:LLM class flavin-dependent oxidoreductase [Herbiconiux oxytropis]MCS5722360.1 LLM class flavin-dependent oxidoreductase [Herbiconiux oxytropis]MCS5727243.1 LLM class flavin-dependent oxidoreductase [Herbiconiux oxytropis]
MKDIEYGIFMPVGSGGWIPSGNIPELDASYRYNLEVARDSERFGFDFTLSQAVWRGYGGVSKHFDVNLESLITSAGLAQATTEIGVWSTVNTALLHPAVAAKMVATQSEISNGRTGLNIVAGGNRMSEKQMGLGLDLDNAAKYRRAGEWVEIVKALWTSSSVDYEGEFFTLEDCQSDPKPVGGVPQMICAATSDTGLAFVAKNLDGVLFEGTSRDSVISIGQRARSISQANGDALKTYCVFMIIPGDTDADAQRRIDHYNEGRDLVAITNMAREWGAVSHDPTAYNPDNESWADSTAISTGTVAGSTESIAEQLADMIEHADVDGAVFIMPDFKDDLAALGEEIMPMLVKGGFGRIAAA